MIRPETFEARLTRTRPLSSVVRELVFERADGAPMAFDPGQWVNLVLPIAPEPVRRAYSIASAPDGSPRLEVAVTRVEGGPGSEYLHGLEIGSTLRVIGPHGLFLRPAGDPPSLFVATGTGITPLRSMVRAALLQGSTAPLWFLFGVRRESDILYRDELERWTREHPNVRFDVTLSQGDPEWAGRRGYVQQHVAGIYRELTLASALGTPHVFVCGLDHMVGAVRELARGPLGVERKHVHVERYD
jgi:ferredoxin-NADP reductase